MIRHFFLDKTNSIIENSHVNMGLNPILCLSYGPNIMRGLIHFDVDEIKKLIEDKTFIKKDKLHFKLKMTNCFSVAGVPYEKELNRINGKGRRASSFDLILFKLPCNFDAGRGFDFLSDFWVNDGNSRNENGSNWFNSKTNVPWINYEECYFNIDEEDLEALIDKYRGIYPFEFLVSEYEAFINNKKSIIVGSQHFDFGDENLDIDITEYINECIETGINNGLCLAFAPNYEILNSDIAQCVDFFNDNTNTFFHPYVEAEYDEYILDSRLNFNLNTGERLYLYVFNDGVPCNLDVIPNCQIDGVMMPVEQATKGVYYVEFSNEINNLVEGSIYYDTWSNLILNGNKIDDVEMEFYVNKRNRKISVGNNSGIKQNVVPSIFGINENEDVSQNEIREIVVDFREKYMTEKRQLISNAWYRLYVKDGEREINVIDYHPIEMANDINYFNIYTMDLIPNKYFIDIKVNSGREMLTYKNVLRFNVVSNVTERYE